MQCLIGTGGLCWSNVGRKATTVQDTSKPTMILSLEGIDHKMQEFLVIHEFGHALGLEHEHQRSDFWKVADSLLDVGKMRRDPRMKNVKFDRDMLEKQSQDTTVITPEYDPDSIMHYWQVQQCSVTVAIEIYVHNHDDVIGLTWTGLRIRSTRI